MSTTMPTYVDLFQSEVNAISHYKSLFPQTTLTDGQIQGLIFISFSKIDLIFGEFRSYKVGEDTVRNEHVKRAVCFEANSIESYNASVDAVSEGALNGGDGGASVGISSEKMGNISTSYKDGVISYGAMGGSGAKIASLLGLLSLDAGVILSRFIRKTYGWNTSSAPNVYEPISCDLSIWGLDGYDFNINGLWLPNCTAFKGA